MITFSSDYIHANATASYSIHPVCVTWIKENNITKRKKNFNIHTISNTFAEIVACKRYVYYFKCSLVKISIGYRWGPDWEVDSGALRGIFIYVPRTRDGCNAISDKAPPWLPRSGPRVGPPRAQKRTQPN